MTQANHDPQTSSGCLVELQRCRDSSSVDELKGILDAAGIPYRVGSDAPVIDISNIGTGNEAQVIISVRSEDYAAARAAMEHDCLATPLPEDHYLLTSSDTELAEILAQPEEWSAFDVAHARRLVNERGIDLSIIAAKREERLTRLVQGKQASGFLLGLGWVSAILGGLLGIAIAWSLQYSKEKTPDGEFFTYNTESRTAGKLMFPVAIITVLLSVIVILYRSFA